MDHRAESAKREAAKLESAARRRVVGREVKALIRRHERIGRPWRILGLVIMFGTLFGVSGILEYAGSGGTPLDQLRVLSVIAVGFFVGFLCIWRGM